jgi:diguanylate cyclase (GGDEF)-like protein/PAS domain S-box-containing protein
MVVAATEEAEALSLQYLLGALFDAGYLVDCDRNIVQWNDSAADLTGYTSPEVVHRGCSDNILMHVDEQGRQLCLQGCPLQQTLDDGEARQSEVFLRHKLGYRVPVTVRILPVLSPEKRVIGAVELFRTTGEPEYWKLRIAELEKAAFIDPLTGIPNRRFVTTRIDHHLHQVHSAGAPFALCMLDLDRFKAVNDSFGHHVGDELLKSVCQTLLNCMRPVDTVGRWGGDELILLLPRTTSEQAAHFLERIRVLIARTAVPSDAGPITITVSMGAVIASRADTPRTLLQRADEQLYRAKNDGRDRFCIA